VGTLKGQNHFQVLGLPEVATSSAVKVAYFRLAKQYHPDTVPPGAPDEVLRLCSELFAAIGEAHRRLGNDKSRAEYLEELNSGGASDVELEQILRGEELFQKGSVQVKARKYQEAVETLSQAILANAEEGEFYAWRGIARFFAATDKRAAFPMAKSDVDEALRRNPRCAPAFFFLGQMAKVLGDISEAAGHFQKTLELQPQHIDAQRELRLLEKK